jgi:AcrR family transcriptional regulator
MRGKYSRVPQARISRANWLQVALDALVGSGVDNVKVLSLAQKLDVSRSSFYWFFRSRDDLLEQLLEHWRETNTRAIVHSASVPASTIIDGVLNIFASWVDERTFDPRLDLAIREWARRSGHVRRAVDQADDARVKAIKTMFLRHGYKERDAFIRARVLYFMQIGYYSIDLEEPLETRLSHVRDYVRVYTGCEPRKSVVAQFARTVKARIGHRSRH